MDDGLGASLDDASPTPGLVPMSDGSPLAGVYAPISTPSARTRTSTWEPCGEPGALRGVGDPGLPRRWAHNGENRSLSEKNASRSSTRSCATVALARSSWPAPPTTRSAGRSASCAAAADLGADCGLVLAPGYFRKQMTDESSIATSRRWPMARRSRCSSTTRPDSMRLTSRPALVERLAGHPNIVGMKDSASSGIETLPRAAGRLRTCWPARPTSSSRPCWLARRAARCRWRTRSRRWRCVSTPTARLGTDHGPAFQEHVTRINHAISGTYGVPGVKAAMDLAGFVGGVPRRPCSHSRRPANSTARDARSGRTATDRRDVPRHRRRHQRPEAGDLGPRPGGASRRPASLQHQPLRS